MIQEDFLLLIDEVLEAEPGTTQIADTLEDLETWDSLAVIQFIALVDERYNVSVAPRKLADCKTVADLMALVQSALAG